MQMDEGARRWMYKTAKQNYWRVCSWYDYEDLIQDGYYWYYSRVQKYPLVVEPKHLMRLFQIRYVQHIHELSNKKTKQGAEVYADLEGIEFTDSHVSPSFLENVMTEAPPAIRTLLKTIFNQPDLLLNYPKRDDGTRETTNGRFCRLAGIPDTVDIIAQLRDYLQGRCLPAV